MFTGIIETLANVADVVEEPPGVRLVIEAPEIAAEAKIGESIALNGCCLTVVSIAGAKISFQAGPETLKLTNLGQLKPGDRVNLEQSLKVGDRLGGHFVTGHVDGLGALASRADDGEWSTFWFELPEDLARPMVAKGSVAIDGVSLTLVEVKQDRFSVMLIPHTLEVTTLGLLKPGDPVNLETDLLAKFVQKQMG